MHLSTLILSILPTTALSAICYPETGGTNCASLISIKEFYSLQYCTYRWNVLYGDWDHFVNNASSPTTVHASVGKTGVFDSFEDCLNGFEDVVETCHGKSQGGVMTNGNVSLNVHFCDW
ncbi:hypothetical protein AbraIFM66950_006421 [Aspergillus brasiliensis]|nr:hypothetical protein AbraIFM66950_006421 [Aspergillus brasiliensis]